MPTLFFPFLAPSDLDTEGNKDLPASTFLTTFKETLNLFYNTLTASPHREVDCRQQKFKKHRKVKVYRLLEDFYGPCPDLTPPLPLICFILRYSYMESAQNLSAQTNEFFTCVYS